MDIVEIFKLGKDDRKVEINLCKASCKDEQTYVNLISNNIKIGHHTFYTDHNIRLPFQCFKCFEFSSHSATDCQNKQKCCKCGSLDHSSDDCKNILKCSNCGGSHHARNKVCPVFIRLRDVETNKKNKRYNINSKNNNQIVNNQNNQVNDDINRELIDNCKKVVTRVETFEEKFQAMQVTVLESFEPIQKNFSILNENIIKINCKVDNLESKVDNSKEEMGKVLKDVLIDYHKVFFLGNKTDTSGQHNNNIIKIIDYHTKPKEEDKEEKKRKRSLSNFLKSMVSLKKS